MKGTESRTAIINKTDENKDVNDTALHSKHEFTDKR